MRLSNWLSLSFRIRSCQLLRATAQPHGDPGQLREDRGLYQVYEPTGKEPTVRVTYGVTATGTPTEAALRSRPPTPRGPHPPERGAHRTHGRADEAPRPIASTMASDAISGRCGYTENHTWHLFTCGA